MSYLNHILADVISSRGEIGITFVFSVDLKFILPNCHDFPCDSRKLSF